MESHQRDHENFLVVSQNRRRRAKALLDFERHDDDELGFRKNDIITVSTCSFCHLNMLTDALSLFFDCISVYSQIISQKDEHCWVGELNGLRGELRWHYNKHWTFLWFSEIVPTTLITYIQLITLNQYFPQTFCPIRLVSSQICGSLGWTK